MPRPAIKAHAIALAILENPAVLNLGLTGLIRDIRERFQVCAGTALHAITIARREA